MFKVEDVYKITKEEMKKSRRLSLEDLERVDG